MLDNFQQNLKRTAEALQRSPMASDEKLSCFATLFYSNVEPEFLNPVVFSDSKNAEFVTALNTYLPEYAEVYSDKSFIQVLSVVGYHQKHFLQLRAKVQNRMNGMKLDDPEPDLFPAFEKAVAGTQYATTDAPIRRIISLGSKASLSYSYTAHRKFLALLNKLYTEGLHSIEVGLEVRAFEYLERTFVKPGTAENALEQILRAIEEDRFLDLKVEFFWIELNITTPIKHRPSTNLILEFTNSTFRLKYSHGGGKVSEFGIETYDNAELENYWLK